MCRPKGQGGLGIEVHKLKNKCLINKWLFKLLNKQAVEWQELIYNKYLHSKTLSQVTTKHMDSSFYKGIFNLKMNFVIEVAY
jgi:hypothetical protein